MWLWYEYSVTQNIQRRTKKNIIRRIFTRYIFCNIVFCLCFHPVRSRSKIIPIYENVSTISIKKINPLEHLTLILIIEILPNTAYSELCQSVLSKMPACCVNKPNMISVHDMSLMSYTENLDAYQENLNCSNHNMIHSINFIDCCNHHS